MRVEIDLLDFALGVYIVQKYKEYIKWVLNRLYKENMPVVIKKCEFYTKKTNFVGFNIKLE